MNGSIIIEYDNKRIIDLARNSIDHKRTYCINISYYFVRELIINQTLRYNYLSTKNIKADDLIKALVPIKFNDFINIIGLINQDLN